ncbi:MAG: enoyl-CoA hydratase/isomerase family protein [Rhodococcus sp. (in: high G+C Gram-positive bacteria)]|nr:MAG: enoyl-CoA hydratase/isomerase family protein [Rhodococcus sp. (in: high G+C Gram-positive bacteria)]
MRNGDVVAPEATTTPIAGGHVTVTRRGAVGVIELSRPEKFNALSRAAFETIRAAIDEFEQPDSGVRSVLITAQGRHFSTGGDLAEAKVMMRDPTLLDDFLLLVHETLQRLENSPLPVIASCRGLALAGGLELALCCDVVFAASDARFGDQHVQYGLVPAWGGTQRIPRLIGLSRALDLMYSGRWIDAETALRWGIVNYVVDPERLDEEATKYCSVLASRSRPGLAAMKRLGRGALHNTLNLGLHLERETVVGAMAGGDPAEGIAAFEARRHPHFTE